MQENKILCKMREKDIYSMGNAYANYFNKAYIVSYRKMPKKKKIFTVKFPGKTPLKLKNTPPPPEKKKKKKKKSDNFNPFLMQAQSALILQ